MLKKALNIGDDKMRLGDVAAVRSGLVLARKQARGQAEHRYPLLNLRAIKADGIIGMGELEVFDAVESLKPEYLTHAGDIIIRLSTPYTAVLIDEETENMVISSSFAIVRANQQYVLPEYLLWLLNTAKVRQQIYENTTGNMLGGIKPSFFNDFRLDLLPLGQQQKIASLNELARREVRLMEALASEKRKYYSCIIDTVQKEMRRGNCYDKQK